MAKKKSRDSSGTVRVSVSFPIAEYRELERIARGRRVSVAWVVRDAVTKYLADLNPLFPPLAERDEEKP